MQAEETIENTICHYAMGGKMEKLKETITKYNNEGHQRDPYNCYDQSGFTPLASALINGQKEMVQYLLDHDANPSLKMGSNIKYLKHANFLKQQAEPII